MARRGPKKKKPNDPGASDPESLKAYQRDFCDWLAVTHYSVHTIRNHKNCLDFFIRWCHERAIAKPSEVNRTLLERYRRHLYHYRKRDNAPLCFKTQLARLVTVRVFFRWLARNHHILYNPAAELELPRTEKRLPAQVLTPQEVETIVNQTDTNDPLGKRDRAILETLYSTGIRRSELINMRLYDIAQDTGTVMIRQGKGRKDRMVPIGDRALAWIDKYLLEVRPSLAIAPDDGTVFLTIDGDPFSGNRLSQLVKDYIDAADLGKTGSCHLFRHAMATHMLENGADIRIIQAILGHEALTTTEIYTRVSIQHLKTVHTDTHPARLRRKTETETETDDDNETQDTLFTALAAEVEGEDE